MYTLAQGRVIYKFGDFTAEVITLPEFHGTTYEQFTDYLLGLPRQAAIAAVFADDFRSNVGMCVVHKPEYVSLVDWDYKTRSLLICHPNLRNLPGELLPREVQPYRKVDTLNRERNGKADFSDEELNRFVEDTTKIDFLYEKTGKITISFKEPCLLEGHSLIGGEEEEAVAEGKGTMTEEVIQENYLTAYLERVRTLYTSTGMKLDCGVESNYYDPVFLREWMNTEYVAHVIQAGRVLDRLVFDSADAIAELGAGPSVLAPYAKHYGIELYANDINSNFVDIARTLGNEVSLKPNGAVVATSKVSTYWLAYQLSSQPGLAIDVVTKHPDAKVLIIDTTDDFDGVELFTKMSISGRSIYYRNMDFKRVVHQDKTDNPPNYSWTNLFDETTTYCVTTPAGANMMRKIQRYGLKPQVCFLPLTGAYKDLAHVVNHTKNATFLIDNYFIPKYVRYLDMKTGVITNYSTHVLGKSSEIYVRQGCFIHVGKMLSSIRVIKRIGSDEDYFYALKTMTLMIEFQGVRRRICVHVYRKNSVDVNRLVCTQRSKFQDAARHDEVMKIEAVDMRW